MLCICYDRFLAKVAETEGAEAFVSKLKIFVGFAQISSFLDQTFSVEWPPLFADLCAWWRGINMDISDFFGKWHCQMHSGGFRENFVIHMAMVPMLVAMLFVVRYLAMRLPVQIHSAKTKIASLAAHCWSCCRWCCCWCCCCCSGAEDGTPAAAGGAAAAAAGPRRKKARKKAPKIVVSAV